MGVCRQEIAQRQHFSGNEMAKIAAIRNRPVQDEKPGWRRYLKG
jgi:hypothetical protein